MDLFDYRERFGQEAIDKLCVEADVQPTTMLHLIAYRKRPGTDLAHRLIAASKDVLTLAKLLRPSSELAAMRQKAAKRVAPADVKAEQAERLRQAHLARARAQLAKAESAATPAAARRHAKAAVNAATKAEQAVVA